MRIDDLEWDEANEDHVFGHGFTRVRLNAVLEGPYLVLRNKRSGSGEYKIVGRDRGGMLVTIVIAQTRKAGVWRPVTAWPSSADEEVHAKRNSI